MTGKGEDLYQTPAPELVQVDYIDDCAILTPTGTMDLYSSPEFKQKMLQELTSPEVGKIIVDLHKAEFLDATFLAHLAGSQKRITLGGLQKELILCNVNANFRKILEITGLDRIIHIIEPPDVLPPQDT